MVIVSGCGSEIAWSLNRDNEAKWLYFFALMGYVTPWVAIFLTFNCVVKCEPTNDYCGVAIPHEYGVRKPPDFVWVAVLGLFITFSAFAVAHRFKISQKNHNSFLYNLRYEVVYSFLSFTSKILLLANIGVGVVQRSSSNINHYTNTTSTISDGEEASGGSTLTYFLLVAGGLSFVLGGGLFVNFRKILRPFTTDQISEHSSIRVKSLLF